MFGFAITLAIASFLVEMMIASKVPLMRQLAKNNLLVNLAISLGLSYFIGIMFGAIGLTAMTAAIISTLMSVPGYAFLEWAYDSEKAHAEGGNRIKHKKEQVQVTTKKWTQTLSDFFKIIYGILKVITFPIWIIRSITNKTKTS
jgi:hypothetical protein